VLSAEQKETTLLRGIGGNYAVQGPRRRSGHAVGTGGAEKWSCSVRHRQIRGRAAAEHEVALLGK
jgi:hypothetical protein